jgi:ribonucleotide reductase alpha subunit
MGDLEMHVVKRNGRKQDVSFDKILHRVKALGAECTPRLNLNYAELVVRVVDQLYSGIPTAAIDELTAEQCASLCTQHPDYGTLAGRIVVSNCQKNTSSSFAETVACLNDHIDVNGARAPLLADEFRSLVDAHAVDLQAMIDYERDYLIDYFGFKTLERAYLMRRGGTILERPQHMWLRVAVAIHGTDLDAVRETYDLTSRKHFTHATPTLFNAGTPHPQLSSCYLLAMESDSINGIYSTLGQCAEISKWAGGIGLHVHNVRATGSHIRGTNGTSNGLVPMLRVFDRTARYVDQGGGKRNGSFAIYLEPWHGDVEAFLDLRKNHGDEDLRARDLFYALWIPSLFMERVRDDDTWSLFCPDASPRLADTYGDEFDVLYRAYEAEGRARKTMPARELWYKILDSQMETGTPYLLYKDACNAKSNQANLGTIKSSNLCTEIVQYSSPTETAVCNLASIALSMFVDDDGKFDYDKLHAVTKVVTANLNRVIDVNFYPTPATRRSNLRHRPIGIGVQGLADAFAKMDVPYHSDAARVINRNIFETMYHAALERSCELSAARLPGIRALQAYPSFDVDIFQTAEPDCREYTGVSAEDAATLAQIRPVPGELHGPRGDAAGAYASFQGSPTSQGRLQFDLWGVKPSDRYDWGALKARVKRYGLRNSLLLAPMPTASTSQILGNNECFEPFTSNIYSRRTIAGDFVVANRHMMRELVELGLWSRELKDNIIANKGSIQHIAGVPDHIKAKYKTVWEMPMRHLIDMAADRGAFICQSQSLNLWVEDPDYRTLTSMHFHSWQQGLKTGIYYLRRKPKHQPQQFTIVPAQDEPECAMCSA